MSRNGGSQVQLAASAALPGSAALGIHLNDLQCPICVETIRDAFVTPCGHTFCYSCITTHLKHKRSCPSCSTYITIDLIHPNFLLNNILSRVTAAASASEHSSLLDVVQTALEAPGSGSRGGEGAGAVAELEAVIEVLRRRKEALQRQEGRDSLQLLLAFLQQVRQRKQAQLADLEGQLHCLEADLQAVTSTAAPQQQQQQQQHHAAAGHPAAQQDELPLPDDSNPIAAEAQAAREQGEAAPMEAATHPSVPAAAAAALASTGQDAARAGTWPTVEEALLAAEAQPPLQASRPGPPPKFHSASGTCALSSGPHRSAFHRYALPAVHLRHSSSNLSQTLPAGHQAGTDLAPGPSQPQSAAAEHDKQRQQPSARAGFRPYMAAGQPAGAGGTMGHGGTGAGVPGTARSAASFRAATPAAHGGAAAGGGGQVARQQAGASSRATTSRSMGQSNGVVLPGGDHGGGASSVAMSGHSGRGGAEEQSPSGQEAEESFQEGCSQGGHNDGSSHRGGSEALGGAAEPAAAAKGATLAGRRSSRPCSSGGGAATELPGLSPAERAAKKRRILSQFEELEQAYLALSRPAASGPAGAHIAAAAGGSAPAGASHLEEGSGMVAEAAPALRAAGGAAPPGPGDGGACSSSSQGGGDGGGGAGGGHSTGAGGAVTACDPSVSTSGQPSGHPGAGGGGGGPAGPEERLAVMSGMLAAATSYSRLVCVAEVPKPGAGANRGANSILSSIDFDSAEQLFATAGAVPDIRIYDYDAVLGSPCKAEVAPLCTIATTAKLSCLGYSPHQRPHLLASDYEGVITQWDTARCAAVQEYESQERRVWSVDWAPHQEGQFASGSDDGHVRLWSVRQAGSVLSLDIKANVCCVKYNPVAPHQLAVGCAAHAVLLFDLRAPAQPLHVLRGHSKAVSYTQYLAAGELISASTDSSLRLWDLSSGACVRSYRGHTNEKNFAGLSVDRHFIACGSETNEVFVYYRAFNKPIMSYKVPPDTASDAAAGGGGGGGSGLFISSVRWKKGSNTLLAANSTGNIHILTMMA